MIVEQIITLRLTEKIQSFSEKIKKDTNFTDFTDDCGGNYYAEIYGEDMEIRRENKKKTQISRILLMIVGQIITLRLTEKTQRFTEKTKKDTNFTDFTEIIGEFYSNSLSKQIPLRSSFGMTYCII